MSSLSSIPFVCSDRPIDFVLRNQGRVLIIKDALYNPSSQKYHDIQLVRSGWKFLGFDLGGGGNFTGITNEAVRQIQSTYGIALKTLQCEPNGAAFWGNAKKTHYFVEEGAAKKYSSGSWNHSTTSYPLGQKIDDIFLSEEDSGRFGVEQMTLHDAMSVGIWNATGWSQNTSAISSNADGSLRNGSSRNKAKELERREGSAKPEKTPGLAKNGRLESFPSIPTYRAKSTPIEMGYDVASIEERKRRVIAHLDRSSPIPFSAFVDNNSERRINPFLFHRMLEGLRKLADNPESRDSDAKYMKGLFKHWFRAAYHYLDKNSKPGDGYPNILNRVLLETDDAARAEIKAKEIYWRRHATAFWMTLVDLFAEEKIGIDPFHQSISVDTSLNPWF